MDKAAAGTLWRALVPSCSLRPAAGAMALCSPDHLPCTALSQKSRQPWGGQSPGLTQMVCVLTAALGLALAAPSLEWEDSCPQVWAGWLLPVSGDMWLVQAIWTPRSCPV